MIKTDQPGATVGVSGPVNQLATGPETIALRGGFAIAEWIAVGLGSIIAAVGLGIVTGSAMLGLLIGVTLLAATWATLLLI